MHVLVAADAQPFAADPHAVARDDRLAAQQRAALLERFGQRVDRDDARQQCRDRRRTLHARQQAAGIDALRARRRRTEKNDTAPTCSESSRLGDRIDRVDGHGFQVGAEHGFDGAFPARLDDAAAAPGAAARRACSSASHSVTLPCARPSAACCNACSDIRRPCASCNCWRLRSSARDELTLALAQPLHFLGDLAQLHSPRARPEARSFILLALQRCDARVDLGGAQLRQLGVRAARAARPAARADVRAARCARARPASSRWRRASRD